MDTSGLSNEDVAKLYETGLTTDKILQIIALAKKYGPVVVEIVLALVEIFKVGPKE